MMKMKLLVVFLCTVLLVDSCAGWLGKKKYKKKGFMVIDGVTYKYKVMEVGRPKEGRNAPELEPKRDADWNEYETWRNNM